MGGFASAEDLGVTCACLVSDFEWTEPDGICAEVIWLVEPRNEGVCGGVWDGYVLDDVLIGVATGVQGVVHDARVHEVVKKVAGDAVEGCYEVFIGVAAGPKSTAVVAEEIVRKGYELGRWFYGG